MPRYDLLACRTSVQWFRVPDKGVLLILVGHKGSGVCQVIRESCAEAGMATMQQFAWLGSLRSRYAAVFEASLGTCCTYMVRSFPF